VAAVRAAVYKASLCFVFGSIMVNVSHSLSRRRLSIMHGVSSDDNKGTEAHV